MGSGRLKLLFHAITEESTKLPSAKLVNTSVPEMGICNPSCIHPLWRVLRDALFLAKDSAPSAVADGRTPIFVTHPHATAGGIDRAAAIVLDR